MQNSCITNDNNHNHNNQLNQNHSGINVLQKEKKNKFGEDDYFHPDLDEKQLELKFDTADQDDNINLKIINQTLDNKISEASERTPMKDHSKKSRIENLNSSDGKENILNSEIKIGLSEYKKKENREDWKFGEKSKSALKTVD